MLVRSVIGVLLLVSSAFAAVPDMQPLRIIRTVEPRYPDGLAQRGIYHGEAKIVLVVDADGKLADWLLTSYSHPLFGREATEALRQWRFEPARRGGQPLDVRTEMVFSFQATGMVVSLSSIDLSDHLQRHGMNAPTHRVCRPQELDGPVTPTRTVAPLWPADWDTAKSESRVVVDFYIDEEGRPRMPVVVQTDSDAVNFAAIEALSHWRFVPPTRGGAPVMVRATIPFRFHQRR